MKKEHASEIRETISWLRVLANKFKLNLDSLRTHTTQAGEEAVINELLLTHETFNRQVDMLDALWVSENDS